MPVYPETPNPWVPPKEPSVMEPLYQKALRLLGDLVGANDPAGAMMGVAGPLMAAEPTLSPALQKAAAVVKKWTGFKAFHGSPHDFDAFKLEKIGTGEGAQAYGHGLYFAENEATAKVYRDDLSRTVPAFSGRPVTTTAESMAYDILKHDGPEKALEKLDAYVAGGVFRGAKQQQTIADVRAAITANLDKVPDTYQQGKMYEVNINADPEHFLDWDQPLSQQSPHVQQAIGQMREAGVVGDDFGLTGPTATGGNFVRSKGVLAPEHNLKRFGVPGIKYFDQGSRSPNVVQDRLSALVQKHGGNVDAAVNDMGRGVYLPPKEKVTWLADMKASYKPPTRNYVVFDDSIVDILKKYGIVLPAAAGAGAAAQPKPTK